MMGFVGRRLQRFAASPYLWSEWIGDNLLESGGILNFVSE